MAEHRTGSASLGAPGHSAQPSRQIATYEVRSAQNFVAVIIDDNATVLSLHESLRTRAPVESAEQAPRAARQPRHRGNVLQHPPAKSVEYREPGDYRPIVPVGDVNRIGGINAQKREHVSQHGLRIGAIVLVQVEAHGVPWEGV